jgi:hypothetical protein
MCPFCISALTIMAAKAAATGGAAILAKVAVHKVRRGSETQNSAAPVLIKLWLDRRTTCPKQRPATTCKTTKS